MYSVSIFNILSSNNISLIINLIKSLTMINNDESFIQIQIVFPNFFYLKHQHAISYFFKLPSTLIISYNFLVYNKLGYF